MNPIYLKRALWSPTHSQWLTGYAESGEYVHTERVFAVEGQENHYTTAEGQVYVVQSWAPDGSGYRDEKQK